MPPDHVSVPTRIYEYIAMVKQLLHLILQFQVLFLVINYSNVRSYVGSNYIVTDLISALPGNSSENTVQHAKID
jgi:hypothetical protein